MATLRHYEYSWMMRHVPCRYWFVWMLYKKPYYLKFLQYIVSILTPVIDCPTNNSLCYAKIYIMSYYARIKKFSNQNSFPASKPYFMHWWWGIKYGISAGNFSMLKMSPISLVDDSLVIWSERGIKRNPGVADVGATLTVQIQQWYPTWWSM